VMKTARVLLVIGIVAHAGAAPAQDGATLYARHCASCHEGGDGSAPGRAVMRRLAPAQIVRALETGAMRVQGAALRPAERRALAAHLSRTPGGPAAQKALPRTA